MNARNKELGATNKALEASNKVLEASNKQRRLFEEDIDTDIVAVDCLLQDIGDTLTTAPQLNTSLCVSPYPNTSPIMAGSDSLPLALAKIDRCVRQTLTIPEVLPIEL